MRSQSGWMTGEGERRMKQLPIMPSACGCSVMIWGWFSIFPDDNRLGLLKSDLGEWESPESRPEHHWGSLGCDREDFTQEIKKKKKRLQLWTEIQVVTFIGILYKHCASSMMSQWMMYSMTYCKLTDVWLSCFSSWTEYVDSKDTKKKYHCLHKMGRKK